MYIIYHCVGGAHSSAIAAAIHLGMLPFEKRPSIHEIVTIPFFDRLTKPDYGRIILRGVDQDGNKVFTLSRQFSPHIVIPAIIDAWELGGGNRKALLTVNTMSAVNFLMKLGGFSSRRLNLIAFGRPIVGKGTQLAYDKLVRIVGNTKEMVNQRS